MRPRGVNQPDRVLVWIKIHEGQLDLGGDMTIIDLGDESGNVRREWGMMAGPSKPRRPLRKSLERVDSQG